nr:hypothetical protein [Tanacetum cinerariifolium]
KFQAQEVEINRLKERVKILEDNEGVIGDKSSNDAPIKGRSTNEGEAPAERISNDSEEIARVLTSMDAATILAGETNKSNKREDMRMNEQIAKDAEVARIYAKEEIQGMIDSLDKSNETVAKYLQEYQQFASDMSLEKKIELISNLVKYQEHYKKLVPVEDVYVQSLQVKHPIIDWSISASDQHQMIKKWGYGLSSRGYEPGSLMRDDSQREACPTDSGFIADQDRATIANLQRQHSELLAKFQAQEVEINRLKERVKNLVDKEGVIGDKSGDDAPIKGSSSNEGEAAAEGVSNDSEEIARVLTFMDAATVLAGETNVPTGSGFIPTAGPPATIAILMTILMIGGKLTVESIL